MRTFKALSLFAFSGLFLMACGENKKEMKEEPIAQNMAVAVNEEANAQYC